MLYVNYHGVLPYSFERFPVELPETIKVNLVPGEFASYAQARGDCFMLSRLFFTMFICDSVLKLSLRLAVQQSTNSTDPRAVVKAI